MKKTTLRQAAMKLALLASVLLAPLGLSAQQSLPYSYGFEDNDLSTDGWSTQNPSGLNASEFGIHTSAAQTGSYGFRFSSYNDNGTSTQYLISPELDAPSGVVVQFSYKKSSSYGTETFKVGYSTTDSDISSFTFGSEITAITSWTLSDEFNFPAGTKYIAIYYYPSYQYRLYIDNITFVAPPSCPKPTSVMASNILHNEATIGWTSTESAWQLVYSDVENFDPNAATPIAVNSASYQLSGLTPLTDYYVYVRSNCTASGNGYSEWSSMLHFSTTAVAVAVGDSWSDNFEGASCGWELINGTLTNAWAWGTATNNGGTHALYVSNDGGTTNAYTHGNTMIYATKLLNFAAGKYEFSYDWNGKGESTYDYMRVALVPASVTLTAGTSYPTSFSSSNLPSGWIALDGGSKLNLVTAWQSKSVAINVAAGNYYLVFAWRNDGSGGSNPPAAVDNVTISRFACPYDVTNLTPSNITTNGATLTWTAGEATQWQVAYSTASNFEGATEEIVSAATYNMTDLTNATIYYVRVRAYCGGTDYGSWCDPISFPTECEAKTIDANNIYTDDFNSYTGSSDVSTGTFAPGNYPGHKMPLCWSFLNMSEDNNNIPQAFLSSYSGYNVSGNSLFFRSSSITPIYAILPEFTNNISDLMLTFTYRNSSVGSYSGTLIVGYMTDPTDANSFVPVDTCNQTTTLTEKEVFFADAPAESYMAFKYQGGTFDNSYLGIDNVSVTLAPTCRKPSALMLDNPSARTAHTATLKWTNGATTQNAWQIAYSTDANFDPDTVTPVDVNTNPATISGLENNNNNGQFYYAYVRANCGNGDYSFWNTTKATFATVAGNQNPTNLNVAENTVSSSSATATWNANAANDLHQLYELYLSTDGTTAPATETVPTHTTTETSYTFTGLSPETEYFVWVRDNCGTDGYSTWVGSESFTTQASCPTPVLNAITEFTAHTADVEWSNFDENDRYVVSYRTAAYFDGDAEEFGTSLPSGWQNRSGLLSNIMNGSDFSASTQWFFGSNNGVFDNHARINIYGSSHYGWLITPEVELEDNVVLNFDLALTAFSGTGAASGTCDDDRFVVLVYANDVWNILREWNNSGSEDVYNNIPTAGENVTIDLTDYVGQTVKIAFYGESTVNANGDNNLHIDNVAIGTAVPAGGWQTVNTTAANAQLTGLVAQTPYEVYVTGHCTTGDVTTDPSDTLTFKTTIACPAPTNLQYVSESLTAHSVDLTWNVNDNPTTSYELTLNDGENTVNNPITVNILNGIATYNLENLAGDKTYTVKVKANCGEDGYSLESNEETFSTPISCYAPSEVVMTAHNTNSITVDWTNGINDPGAWEIAYMDPENDADYTVIPNVTEKPYTIESLAEATTYSIKVRANCGSVDGYSQWSAPSSLETDASCATPEIVAVTDGSETAHGATITWTGESPNYQVEYGEASVFSFSESFDGGSMPAGWSTTSSNWSIIDNQNAGGSANEVKLNWQPQIENGTTRLITPAFDLSGITSVTVSFKHMLDYYDGNYTRILGIATSSDDGTTWNTGWSQEFTNNVAATTISQVITTPDMGMSNVKFCIYFQGDSYGINDWYFDDIEINGESLPTSWTVADNNVANNANTGTYTFNNLNPETTYFARVKGNCSGTLSPASNIVGFTTLVACQAPTALTVGTPTHEQVVLSWTENGEATNWVVAYKAESETEYNELNVTTNPYTLDGLDENTPYSVKVKADCGSTEGTSDWSNEETFTTLEACAAPTAFILDDVEAHQATFSWTAGNGNAAWKVYVKKHNENEYPDTYTEANTVSATIDELEAATAYDVKIVPTCDESKTLEVENAFTTECEAITISAEGWTENFDNYTGNSTSHSVPSGYPNHTMPTCWKFLNMSTNSENYPQAFLSTKSGYPVSGNCLFFRSSLSTPIYAILPEFTNNTSDLAITFTYRNEGNTEMNGTIIVGYMTDPDDANTFEPVLTCDRTTTLTTKTATFTGAPNGSYIAFKYQGGTYSNYYASIDDVIVYTVIEKTIEAKKWYAIASPVHNDGNNETLAGVIGLTGTDFAYDLYGYTESAGTWNTPTFLEQGKGYIYRRSEGTTLQFVGIANTGSISVNVSSSCPDIDLKGFNLIGNPYPHDITFTNSYYSLNTNGTWQAHTSGTIGVAEAFLVQTNEGGSIDFPDQLPDNSNTASASLAFTVSNGEYSDVAYAMLENGEGLRKIGHLNSEAPMLSIPVEGRRYAIANLGSDCQSFNLVFRGVNGTYTIKQSSNQAIAYCHLIDRVAGKDIDMLRQPSYTFSSNGFDADRFMVKLSPDAQENANGNFAYWNGNNWMVEGNGTLQVFDALGRQLFSQEISNSNFEIQNSLFPAAGVYVLRMGEKTQKIVVR